MANRMQQRRGTAAEWTAADPVLAAGEIGFETDTGKFKFGDGTNTWSNLQAFSDASAIIGGAPGTLDTLEELAAAINDNPEIYSDVADNATAIATINSDIADLTITLNGSDAQVAANAQAALEAAVGTLEGTISNLQGDVDVATGSLQDSIDLLTANLSEAETSLGAAIDANELAIETEATDRDDAIEAHNLVTTNVHGIADTSVLATESYVDDKSVEDKAYADGLASNYDAAGTAASQVTSHNSTTTNVHGIADTSVLATSTDVSNAQSAAQTYADGLAVNYDAAGSATSAQAAAESTAATALSAHESDTTNVHGIADTSDLALLSAAAQTFNGNITIGGNLTVSGETVTVSASDLSVRDNMIYLNQAGLFDLAGAVGDGSNVVYTTATDHDIKVGDYITVSSANPSSFDLSGEGLEVTAVTADTITVASTVTDTYVDGGSLRGKSHANPDLGWSAGRYDTVNGSGYAHAGIFRDASDGVFKFFDGYTPEPDESVFIDTAHATFALADLSVADLTADSVTPANGIVFSDGTQVKVGVPSITPITEKTAAYTLSNTDERDTIIEVNSGSAVTLTIPEDATVDFPVGSTLDIIQTGTGQVTIAGSGSAVVNGTPGTKLRTQWSSVTLLKRAANSWLVFGDTSA